MWPAWPIAMGILINRCGQSKPSHDEHPIAIVKGSYPRFSSPLETRDRYKGSFRSLNYIFHPALILVLDERNYESEVFRFPARDSCSLPAIEFQSRSGGQLDVLGHCQAA
jgi:hypothetical protein